MATTRKVTKAKARTKASAKTKATKATKSPKAAKAAADFDKVFARLRALMKPLERELVVKADAPGNDYLGTTQSYKGRPVFFGAVRAGKAHVSYHLFPFYMYPDLLAGVSAGLKKRMQGKSCFNFTAVDDAAFAELGRLTQQGLDAFRLRGLPI